MHVNNNRIGNNDNKSSNCMICIMQYYHCKWTNNINTNKKIKKHKIIIIL